MKSKEDKYGIEKLTAALSPCNECALGGGGRGTTALPVAAVARTLRRIFALLFPGCHGIGRTAHTCADETCKALERIAEELTEYVEWVCRDGTRARAEDTVRKFLGELPAVRAMLQNDITAGYEGDPAATSKMEVVMAYPGLLAIAVHRLAHVFYRLQIPILPRVMSELAHSRTGIDIHPGAQIGERFFIDHGTGVVIGETTVIGRNVKLYQGVTLGALSFPKDESTGMLMKGHKRHPNVEDNVVIYAGATILGGDTVIGHDSEIGGNVWLMDSIPPYSRVYNQTPFPRVKTHIPNSQKVVTV